MRGVPIFADKRTLFCSYVCYVDEMPKRGVRDIHILQMRCEKYAMFVYVFGGSRTCTRAHSWHASWPVQRCTSL